MATGLIRLLIAGAVLCCGCARPTAPSAVEPAVDVLDFLIGDPALWPRIGNHYSNQIVDRTRREVCWVKYANPRRFECWRWDDNFIYHATDNAVDGDTGESYTFTDGRWLPRYLQGDWSLDVADNRILWFNPACGLDGDKTHGFPYRQSARLLGKYDAGGDLGQRDTIVLEYAPYDPVSGRSIPEHFYFAKGAGWYEWEREGVSWRFNRLGGPVVPMNRSVWCSIPP
jgi:hypothetical protein